MAGDPMRHKTGRYAMVEFVIGWFALDSIIKPKELEHDHILTWNLCLLV